MSHNYHKCSKCNYPFTPGAKPGDEFWQEECGTCRGGFKVEELTDLTGDERVFDAELATKSCTSKSHNWPNEAEDGWCNCGNVVPGTTGGKGVYKYPQRDRRSGKIEKHGEAPSFQMR